MSIAAADLLLYGSASRPEDDTSLTGGAVTLEHRPEYTELTANAVIAVISDGADTRTVTVKGRNAAGAVVSDVITLNGAVEALGVVTFERIQSVIASATSASRTVTVKQGSGGATKGTIPVNEIGFYRLFLNSASESGIATRYEKVFWRNNHATLTLNAALVRLTVDASAKIKIGLAATKGDSATIANRKAVPAGISFVDDNVDVSVPGTILEALTNIGVWIEQTLSASDIAYRSSFTQRLSGSSV